MWLRWGRNCERCHSRVPSGEKWARLKWQLVIWLSSADWEERRRRIWRPLQSFIGSISLCCLLPYTLLLLLSLSATTEIAAWQLDCSIPTQVHAHSDVLNAAFIFAVLTQQDGVGALGGKGSQEALIITSCFHHLLPKVLCLLLPHASTQMFLSEKRQVDLILRNISFPYFCLLASTHFPPVMLILFT